MSTPLCIACIHRRRDAIILLIASGANINHGYNTKEGSPLHHIAYVNDVDIAELLIEYGADVSSRDIQGNTPLHLAAITGIITPMTKMLIKNGASINATNNDGNTPTDIARLRRYMQIRIAKNK